MEYDEKSENDKTTANDITRDNIVSWLADQRLVALFFPPNKKPQLGTGATVQGEHRIQARV